MKARIWPQDSSMESVEHSARQFLQARNSEKRSLAELEEAPVRLQIVQALALVSSKEKHAEHLDVPEEARGQGSLIRTAL